MTEAVNQWTGFYMIAASVMKELICSNLVNIRFFFHWTSLIQLPATTLFHFQAEKYGDSFVMDYFVPDNINKEIKQAVSVNGFYTGWDIFQNEPLNLSISYIISLTVGICANYQFFNCVSGV